MSTLDRPGVSGKTHWEDRIAKPLAFREESEKFKKPEEIYDEIACTLRVSIVDQPFRTWGKNPPLLRLFWSQLKPNLETQYLESAAERIREKAVMLVSSHMPLQSDHKRLLEDSDVSMVTVQQIRFTIDLHHYVNPKLLLCTSFLVENLLGHSFEHVREDRSLLSIPKGIPRGIPKIPVLREEFLGESTTSLLREIKQTLRLPSMVSDYLSLARYPTYLQLAWAELKPMMRKDSFLASTEDLRSFGTMMGKGLPYPLEINREALSGIGVTLPQVMVWVMPFHMVLPSLILNMAALKICLDGKQAAMESPYPVP